jgi:hypothetical protein
MSLRLTPEQRSPALQATRKSCSWTLDDRWTLNAKSFAELIELNFTHSFNQFYALFRQADEFGELFVRVIADVAETAVSHVEEESNGSR